MVTAFPIGLGMKILSLGYAGIKYFWDRAEIY
jgi:hypothetical protein